MFTAIQTVDVHAVWNTGREYSGYDHRMSAQMLQDGRVAFLDLDRHIDGITRNTFVATKHPVTSDEKPNPQKLAEFVVTEYDYGRYDGGLYTLDNNDYSDASFAIANELKSKLKIAAQNIHADGPTW